MTRAIGLVKLNNWQDFFANRINEIRQKELHYLAMRKYLDALCVYLWASAPILITVAILSTYTLLLQEQLTAAKVFTSLALVSILITPLNSFPWVLNAMVEALVSKKRLDGFFSIDSAEPFSIYSLTDSESKLIQLEGAVFSWGGTTFTTPTLSFTGTRGSIIGVCGPVGTGKSTTLLGILGEAEIPLPNHSLRIRQETIHQGWLYNNSPPNRLAGTLR